MERITEFVKRSLFFTGLAMGAMSAVHALADVVFKRGPQPAQQTQPSNEEAFPESRFGAPPAKPFPGASRAAAELDADDEDTGGTRSPGRAPAGLDFANGQGDVGTVKRPYGPRVARTTPSGETPTSVIDATATAITRKGVQEVALIAGDLGFFPKTVFVSRDVPVRLYVTGASKNTLCIMMDSFQVRKQVRSQKIEEITFTPNVPGQYRFYCPVNGSEGLMIVKELSS